MFDAFTVTYGCWVDAVFETYTLAGDFAEVIIGFVDTICVDVDGRITIVLPSISLSIWAEP